jgi:hypothetical protein
MMYVFDGAKVGDKGKTGKGREMGRIFLGEMRVVGYFREVETILC